MEKSKLKININKQRNLFYQRRKDEQLKTSKTYLEEVLVPLCGFEPGNGLIPLHRDRHEGLMKHSCNDGRVDECPFGYNKNGVHNCNYKK